MTPDPAHSAWPETAQAASTLEKAMRAAGLNVRASVQGTDAIVLGRLGCSDATLLTTLINNALSHARTLAEELRQALLAHDIDVTVRGRKEKTHIRELTMPQVDTLTLILGAAPYPAPLNEDDYFEDEIAERLCERLADISEPVLGEPIAGDFYPYCPRHGEAPGLMPHGLTAEATRRLITALDNAVKSD
ncbi:hypothetical protein [Streptomyces sp. NPDC002067]